MFFFVKDHEKDTVIDSLLVNKDYKNHSLQGYAEVSCPSVYLRLPVSILIITITIYFILHLFFSFM
mgnify:CR=1 FL=1